jgi:hypothetical protein
MYWQVYLHKTVLCAEKMLVKIIERAGHIGAISPSPVLNFFLNKDYLKEGVEKNLEKFCLLDDGDILFAVKSWVNHPDKVLSTLCRNIFNRKLLKVIYSGQKIPTDLMEKKKKEVMEALQITHEEAGYLVFSGEAKNTTYNKEQEYIKILFKDGSVRDISEVDNALINQSLFGTVKKFYICFMNIQS